MGKQVQCQALVEVDNLVLLPVGDNREYCLTPVVLADSLALILAEDTRAVLGEDSLGCSPVPAVEDTRAVLGHRDEAQVMAMVDQHWRFQPGHYRKGPAEVDS